MFCMNRGAPRAAGDPPTLRPPASPRLERHRKEKHFSTERECISFTVLYECYHHSGGPRESQHPCNGTGLTPAALPHPHPRCWVVCGMKDPHREYPARSTNSGPHRPQRSEAEALGSWGLRVCLAGPAPGIYLEILDIFGAAELRQAGGPHQGKQVKEQRPVAPQDRIGSLTVATESVGVGGRALSPHGHSHPARSRRGNSPHSL